MKELWILGLIVFSLLVYVFSAIRAWLRKRRAAEFTGMTDATIQAAVIMPEGFTSRVEVAYEYEVHGQFYSGSTIRNFFIPGSAERFASKFQPRGRAQIQYDSERPERSHLA